jgi:anaerobic ribonucleoside-triphosphate reductase activating protein
MVLQNVKLHFPEVKTYLWTGYYYEELLKMSDPKVKMILEMIDVLIDGPYVEELRNTTLKMRGSENQNIIPLKNKI